MKQVFVSGVLHGEYTGTRQNVPKTFLVFNKSRPDREGLVWIAFRVPVIGQDEVIVQVHQPTAIDVAGRIG